MRSLTREQREILRAMSRNEGEVLDGAPFEVAIDVLHRDGLVDRASETTRIDGATIITIDYTINENGRLALRVSL